MLGEINKKNYTIMGEIEVLTREGMRDKWGRGRQEREGQTKKDIENDIERYWRDIIHWPNYTRRKKTPTWLEKDRIL